MLTAGVPDVILTRERGKNAALEATLRSQGVATWELPMVETAAGPDRCGKTVCAVWCRTLKL